MSNNEVFRLRKELELMKEKYEEIKQQNIALEDANIKLSKECDEFQEAALQGERIKQKTKALIEEAEKKVSEFEKAKYDQTIQELNILKNQNVNYNNQIKAYLEEINSKDQQILNLRRELKNLKRRQEGPEFNENKWEQDQKEQNETENSYKKKLEAERQKFSQLSEKMDNILAENRVLRRLAQVPENYGFNLEEIKIAEMHQIEDYKAQNRTLEKLNEELEAERLQLRNRLRTLSNLYDQRPKGERYKNLTKEQLEKLDQYVADHIINQLPNTKMHGDSSKMHEKDMIIKDLQERLKQYERDSNFRNDSTYMASHIPASHYNADDIKNLTFQNEQLKQMLAKVNELLEEIKKNGGRYPADKQQQGNPEQIARLQGNQSNLARPPQPMPGSFGDWEDISQVKSFKFKQMIPADIFELYSGVGFDTVLAKYQIAQLQVMNLESMKMLKVKEEEYKNMEMEVEEMKRQLQNCLRVQDNLYEKYYEETTKLKENIKIYDSQLGDKTAEVQKLKEELNEYKKMNELHMKNDKNLQLQKIAELTHKISKLDVTLIKISRKYSCLQDEYNELSESYKNMNVDFRNKEEQLIQKIHSLLDWKKKASHYLKVLLQECQNSVSKSKHNILRNKFEKSQDDLANIKEKNTALLSQIQKLKNYERELDERNTKIRIMEDEMVELQLETELIKKMLEMSDQSFRRYQQAMQKLVQKMQQKNISPMQVFAQIDDNRDGELNPSEFQLAMRKLKVDFSNQEIEILFRFMDFDGNNKIDLKEFSRKMRRQGLTIRKSQEQVIFTLWEKMQQAGLSISDAFQAFDKDRSGEVTKDEMLVTLQSLIKDIEADTVDYVFKIADTSGDGKITYSEFHALFENIIQDVMRQQILMNVEELSWQKQLVLKIDEAIHQQGQYIKDLYNYIDNSGDEKISLKEFKGLFENLKVDISDEQIKQLFRDIDNDSNGYIEYNELLNYIKQATVEKNKIQKMKKISDKIKEMQKQHTSYDNVENQDIQALPKEARLEMKISLMEIKEKNLLNRCDTLMYSLNLSKKENARIQLQLNEREGEILSIMKKYNEAQRLNYKYLNIIQGSETKFRAKQIHNLNKRVLKENVELRSQNRILKDLHEFSSNQVKDLLITLERKKFETEHLHETIKDLQSLSDEKAVVGKLQHSLMVSRFNQAQTNIKYDNLIHDYEKQQYEVQILEHELAESKDDAIETREILRQKITEYEDLITDLRSRILPTINMSKIDEMYSRINELSSMKMNLEIQNKKLRDENHELAIKCDYFEALEQQFDTLKRDLQNEYPDELHQRIIELSMQVSEQRLLEMKAKRDQELAKEKEEYFSRITRQHLEHVKQLENELEQVNKKFNDREQFWRQKHQEAMEMVMNDKVAKDKEEETLLKLRRDAGKTNKLVGVVRMNKDTPQPKTPGQKIESGEETEVISELKQQLQLAKDIEMKLKDENDRLSKQLKELNYQIKRSNNEYQPSRVQQAQIFNEEGEKLAQAAQKTISTLQSIIDDKNHEIERKDLLIEKMKRDYRIEKEKDSQEIRRLIAQINLAPNSISAQNPSMVVQSSSHFNNNQYWDDVGNTLDQKDRQIEQLNNMKDNLEVKQKTLEAKIVELEQKIRQLEDELILERRNNQTQELEAKVASLDKLLKKRDKDILEIKRQQTDLANDYKKAIEQNLEKEDQYRDKVLQVKKDNKELSNKVDQQKKDNEKLELEMKEAIKTIRQLKQQLSSTRSDVDQLQIQESKSIKESQKEKIKLGGRVESESQNIAVIDMKKLLNKEKAEKEKVLETLKKLEVEKKELLEKIEFIKKQGLKSDDLFDEENFLKPYKKSDFQNAEDVAFQIRRFVKENPSFNLIQELKNSQEKQSGNITVGNLKKLFDKYDLKIRQEDYNLLTKPVQATTSQGMKSTLSGDQQPLNIIKLFYLINNVNSTEIQSEQQIDVDVKGKGDIPNIDRSDGFKPQATKEKFGPASTIQASNKIQEDLQKRNDMLKAQLSNIKDEKDKIQKQLNLKSEQCKSLETQLKKQMNKTGLEMTPLHRQSSGQNQSQQAEAVSELKDMIFELEDEKNTLNQHLRTKELELKKVKEEKTKLEEQLKELKIHNLKLNNQIDSLSQTKIHPDDLKQNIILEKDLLIKDLKDKLDKQRREEQNLIDQLYNIERDNKELKFAKEQFDVQVQRLNRRIGELEESKRSGSLNKFQAAGQGNSTLKKVPSRK
ncbi:EF-hand pair protein (macronuclear) [Tetrahymena thermophila SB210]|uniref:EF-hand pair protein n=1 Tax=Tetrahymena thermophila (strain SB210) TaxID=312017 RepID=Q23K94_TETTS|nr:EF-hand pair protein [Tetrahymena thermophila SB210]EAR96949.2 EF-hand pair protein [Tetrahymena thermophila SB210]|eukprot:XP_001017194.2 EF-hand pair protein [Tetrahymena thermophila SB210]